MMRRLLEASREVSWGVSAENDRAAFAAIAPVKGRLGDIFLPAPSDDAIAAFASGKGESD